MTKWLELLVAKGLFGTAKFLTVVGTAFLNHAERQVFQVPDLYEDA